MTRHNELIVDGTITAVKKIFEPTELVIIEVAGQDGELVAPPGYTFVMHAGDRIFAYCTRDADGRINVREMLWRSAGITISEDQKAVFLQRIRQSL